MSNTAIILAGGTGSRFNAELPKQFIKVAGKPIIEHTINQFEKSAQITEIIIVTNPEYYDYTSNFLENKNFTKVKKLIKGGNSRRESSLFGLKACSENTTNVLIHDAVRPFVSEETINNCLKALIDHKAVDVAIPSADTVIQINDKMIIKDIPERKFFYRGQTPQAFNYKTILEAHRLAEKDKNDNVTCDCGLINYYNLADIFVVQGENKNIKVTYPEDLFLADKLFQLNTLNFYNHQENEFKRELENKVIVIFGGLSGFGASINSLSKNYNSKNYVFSRSTGCNIANYEEVRESLESVHKKEGKIDYIVNSAGILSIQKLEQKSSDEIDEEIKINFNGTVNIAKASISYLRETKGSLLFFTSSSYTRGRGMYSLYSSTKAATVNFTQALAEELICDDINVNVINPERANTPMRWKNFGNEPKESLLCPETVAIASLNTLISDFTGQVIDVRRDKK